jgi:uncharacterized integral membrane protein
MTRWLVAILAAALGIAAGYVIFINPHEVEIYLAPGRARPWPLGAALLVSFAGGAALVGALAGMRAGARGWRSWRTNRRHRREARRAAVTARAQQLVWAGDYRQARTELLRAEGGVPGDADRLVLLAETYLHEGDAEGARKLVDEGIHKVGFEPRLLDLLGEAAERPATIAPPPTRSSARGPHSRTARDSRAGCATSTPRPAAGPTRSRYQGALVLRVRDAATLAREEETMRGLRSGSARRDRRARRGARARRPRARGPGLRPRVGERGRRAAATAVAPPHAGCGSAGRAGPPPFSSTV